MKNIIKKYRGLALLIALFVFSLHINAVFEGRNEQLKEYTAVRNQVELSSFESEQKASSVNPGTGKPTGPTLGSDPAPISDAPWFIFALGLGYGVYMFSGKKRKKVFN